MKRVKAWILLNPFFIPYIMNRTKYSQVDMLKFAKFSKENEDLKPTDRLRKYNKENPELTEEEKRENIINWMENHL